MEFVVVVIRRNWARCRRNVDVSDVGRYLLSSRSSITPDGWNNQVLIIILHEVRASTCCQIDDMVLNVASVLISRKGSVVGRTWD